MAKKKSKSKSKSSSKSKKINQNSVEEAKKRFITYSKAILAFVIINSELQIWASYLLAYLGRESIAESLSEQVVIVVIGSLIPYFAKSLIENLSKRTTLFGKNLPYENASDSINANNTVAEGLQNEAEINLNSIDEESKEV